MGIGPAHRLFDVEREYHDRSDVDFAEFVAQRPPMDDAQLAELIETDGRIRVELGRAVELSRYLRAVPDLRDRSEPLDAAIDVTLRSMAAFGIPQQEAERQLIANHPDLERAIREAGALSGAMLATIELRARIGAPKERPLPADFGPSLQDGRARYQLLALVGRGTGGEVYRATDRLLSEEGHEALVAVKVLNPADPTPWGRQRFIDEATKARRINHANVVRVIDRGLSEKDEEFIVYEYVAGGDLHAWVSAHPHLSPAEAVRLIAGIARGVQAAHSASLVHCDLKPGNIVLTPEGEAKVADFGVAVRREPWSSDRSGAPSGERIGNVAFISPEQYRMEPGSLVPGSDVYAIGGMLYWLLTGRLPNGEALAEIERTHDREEGRKSAPSVRSVRAQIDRDLDGICSRCLAPRIQDRYQSAAQLADDLEAWLRLEPIPWTRPTLARTARLWVRRKPTLAATYAVLLAVVVAGAGAIWNLRAQAAAGRLQASRAKDKLEWTRQLRGDQAARVSLFIETFKPWAMGDAYVLLPVLPYFDWMLGTNILGDPATKTPPWRDRIEIIRGMLDESRRRYGSETFQTLCLESTLAFWLVAARRADEAAPILTANREAWLKILAPDQPWHRWLEGLSECAAVESVARQAHRPLPSADRARLASAARTLEDIFATFGRTHTEVPFRIVIGRTLKRLYGPELLDEPQRLTRYKDW